MTVLKKVKAFSAVYYEELERAIKEQPDKYAFPLEEVPFVVIRMEAAFINGNYNHDGIAIKRTCKRLGIKHTRKGMEAFFNSGIQ